MSENASDTKLIQELREVLGDSAALLTRMKTHALEAQDILHAPVFSAAAELNIESSAFVRSVARAVRQGLSKYELLTFMLPGVEYCQHCEPEAIVDLLAAFVETWHELPDNVVPLISKVFSRVPGLSRNCIEIALGNAGLDPRVAPTLAMAAAVSDRLSSVPYLLNLAESSDTRYGFTGLAGLCTVDANSWRDAGAHLNRAMDVAMQAIRNEERQRLGYRLLNHISLVEKRAELVVSEGVIAGDEKAQIETAQWLRLAVRDYSSEHTSRMLDALARAAVENKRVRVEVEGTIMSLTFFPETQAIGLAAIDQIGRLFSGQSLEEEFRQIYNTIVSDNERYMRVVSRWLLMSGVSFTALRSLLAYAQTSPNRLVPDISAFRQADERMRVRAIRRLIGLCYNGGAIAGFLTELASDASTESWALRAFSEVLENYLRVEYPSETQNFLKARLALIPSRSKLYRVMAKCLKLIRDWDKVLRGLPDLKELQPRQEKLVTLKLADRKRNREIGRNVRQKSVFAMLATQVHVKQGRGVVTKMPDGTSTVTPLRPHSVNFEVPGSEVADPLLGQLLRHQYLTD